METVAEQIQMVSNEKMKSTITVLICIGGLVVFGLWYLGLIGGEKNTKSALSVPDGYTHLKSETNKNETVHTFKKAQPKAGAISQTADQTYARYMQSLPDTLDKAIAQEFRTLNISLQNARLYADTTGLIRQGRENMNQLNQLKEKQNEQEKEQAMAQNNVGFLVDENQRPNVEFQQQSIMPKKASIDDVILEGVVGSGDGYYAVLKDTKGNTFTLKPGQTFDGRMLVKSVNTKEVVIKDGAEERTIPVM